MSKIAIGLFVFTVAAFRAAAPVASEDVWTLAMMSGEVSITGDVLPGETVPFDATIRTGHDGRALLIRGTEAMLVGPGTTMTVDESSRWTREGYDRPAIEGSDILPMPAGLRTPSPDGGPDQGALAAVVKA